MIATLHREQINLSVTKARAAKRLVRVVICTPGVTRPEGSTRSMFSTLYVQHVHRVAFMTLRARK
jgi:hypothetical protein